MSIYRTNSATTDARTGLPVITGLQYVTMSGQLYSTNPVGESPYGANSTPGTDPNVPGSTATGGNPNPSGNTNPGAPYGFTPPVVIGPTS